MAETPIAYDFNEDPAWQIYAQSFERVIIKIVQKFAATDESLQMDCAQEARIALATIRPERIVGYNRIDLTEQQRKGYLDRYMRNVIRNAVLSYLDSYSKGNWYIGRTRYVKDKESGEVRRVYMPPRFSSLDMLVEEHGMQVDEHCNISWADPSDDGLPHPESSPRRVRSHTPWVRPVGKV
jgi:hypothetical protein